MWFWSEGRVILKKTVSMLQYCVLLWWCTKVQAVLTGWSTVLGFDPAWFSSLSSECLCVFGLHGDDGVVQQPPLPQQMFFQLLRIMDLRTADPLLKDTPDAVVHPIQIWRIGWPRLWRDKLLASLSAAWWQCHVHCHVHGERHDFSDMNITSPGKGCIWHAT